jgi:hypothetical protein
VFFFEFNFLGSKGIVMRKQKYQSLSQNVVVTGIVLSGLLMLQIYAGQSPLLQISDVGGVGLLGQTQGGCQGSVRGHRMVKTALYFGLSKPNGLVTNAEFQQFLDREITPRFPNGLTLLEGHGQFRTSGGKIMAERSRVLILLYPFKDEDSNQKIEKIRTGYQKTFQQESVLRIDDQICAAF